MDDGRIPTIIIRNTPPHRLRDRDELVDAVRGAPIPIAQGSYDDRKQCTRERGDLLAFYVIVVIPEKARRSQTIDQVPRLGGCSDAVRKGARDTNDCIISLQIH